jgi:glycosyltransferase involved in cell wall biosynthesis
MSHAHALHVCHIIHTLAPGGAERVLIDLARAAPQADLELSVLSLMPQAEHRYVGMLGEFGVRVQSLELSSRWDLRALYRVLPVVRKLRPDLLHTHLKHADLIGAFAARRLALPMVSTLHVIEDRPAPLQRALRWLAAKARISTADRTLAVSDAVRRWYLETFPADPDRVLTVHNGVMQPHLTIQPEARDRLRENLGVPPGSVMATMVGLIRPGKGHADLIASAGRLPPDLDLHIVIVGDGSLRPTLEAQAARNGAGHRVHFTGYRTDVPAILAASDIVVQPSLFDALPTALIEGLAAGLPAVASRVGGIEDIITPEVGILIPPGNPDALVRNLVELAGDPRRRQQMGRAARRRFEQEFDAVRWVRRLRSIYEEVIADRGRRSRVSGEFSLERTQRTQPPARG